MEKERLNYQAPTISQRRVVLQEMIAGSFTDDTPALKGAVSFSVAQMKLTEGLDRGEINEDYSSFTYDWYEE